MLLLKQCVAQFSFEKLSTWAMIELFLITTVKYSYIGRYLKDLISNFAMVKNQMNSYESFGSNKNLSP
jgi:hypothetical protein